MSSPSHISTVSRVQRRETLCQPTTHSRCGASLSPGKASFIHERFYTYNPCSKLSLQPLQFIPSPDFTHVRHSHDLHHQARPACEVLRSLAKSCLGVVLLPREACSFPIVEDVFYKILAEVGVELGCAGFVGALGLG